MKAQEMEEALEAVLRTVTGASSVSVCILGQEISVNVNGKLYNFVAVGKTVLCVPTPQR